VKTFLLNSPCKPRVSAAAKTLSSLIIDHFEQFLTVDSVRNLLVGGMHIAHIVWLHYLVKHEYLITNNIYG